MEFAHQTFRQQIMCLLENQRASTYEISTQVGLTEKHVENHLRHIVKTIARAPTKTFILHPAECRNCHFSFRTRTRLTCPSRCPKCRSEAIIPPRYGIKDKRKL